MTKFESKKNKSNLKKKKYQNLNLHWQFSLSPIHKKCTDTFMAKGLHYFRDWPTSAARTHYVEGLLADSYFHLTTTNQNKAASKLWPMVFKMTIKLKLLRNTNDFECKPPFRIKPIHWNAGPEVCESRNYPTMHRKWSTIAIFRYRICIGDSENCFKCPSYRDTVLFPHCQYYTKVSKSRSTYMYTIL